MGRVQKYFRPYFHWDEVGYVTGWRWMGFVKRQGLTAFEQGGKGGVDAMRGRDKVARVEARPIENRIHGECVLIGFRELTGLVQAH
jgi:hypothetical protein